jgi:hypothetical protein
VRDVVQHGQQDGFESLARLRDGAQELAARGLEARGVPVYHFVHHRSREGPVADAITLSEQKQNPPI